MIELLSCDIYWCWHCVELCSDHIPLIESCMLLMCMHAHFVDGSFPLCGIELAGPIQLPSGQR